MKTNLGCLKRKNMKHYPLNFLMAISVFLCMQINTITFAQNGVSINEGGLPPDPSAILDVSSVSSGLLIPRMSTIQRNSIDSPALGLQIYNTTTRCFEFYCEDTWVKGSCYCPPVSAPTTSAHLSGTDAIEWNWNAVSGAIGYRYNSTSDYSTAVENLTNTSFTQVGLETETAYNLYVWAYNNCGVSDFVTLTQTTNAGCPESLAINHSTVNGVAPVDKSVTYDVVSTSISGTAKCWITRNLGASIQAASASDVTEDAAGWYWQFNRKQGYKHDGAVRTPNSAWTASIDETSDWTSANDPCTLELGTGWRLPTSTEWSNAIVNGPWANHHQAFGSVLKLHSAGILQDTDAALLYRGTSGFYWSRTQNSTTFGMYYALDANNSYVNPINKAYGFPVRCLRD